MTLILVLVLALVTLLDAPALAAPEQGGAGPQRQGGPGPRAAARPRPRIDPLTASIRGRVTAADTGAPVRRAEVRANSGSGTSRLVTTDGDGRYELRDLPAGTFTLTISRTGFVSLRFGQRRPLEAPIAIELAEGERFTADISLPRGSAITGRVYNEFGEPVADVRVQTLRSRMIQGRRRLQPIGAGDRTDDTGAFRVHGLAPGDYYVAASGGGPDQPPGPNVKASVPTYYPGTPIFEEAQRITLGLGAEASADIHLLPIRTARVSGVVIDSAGAPVGAMVNLSSETVGLGYVNAAMGPVPMTIAGHADAAADGAFVLSDVPPGSYTLNASIFGRSPRTVRTVDMPLPMDGHESASIPLVVGNDDVTGLTLVTGTGGTLTGTFVRDAGVVRALPANLGVEARGTRSGGMWLRMRSGSGFTVTGMTGPFHLEIEGLPEGWAVKAITVDGNDVTDSPIDLKGAQNATAQIVLTDRVTEVTGTLTSDDAARASIVLFAEDQTKWTYPSRHVRTVRADDQGVFRVSGLPGGERYRALALDYLEDGEADDPEFLARMLDRATSFSLGEGERKTLGLRLVER
jgi:hypothetical protein